METANTIQEFQLLINKVKETKQPIKVKVTLPDEEIERGKEELQMEGIEIIMGREYDEIKPI
jgi:hypothetical protein